MTHLVHLNCFLLYVSCIIIQRTGIFGQSLSKFFYNPNIQTVIKIQKRCINVYRFCYIFGNS